MPLFHFSHFLILTGPVLQLQAHTLPGIFIPTQPFQFPFSSPIHLDHLTQHCEFPPSQEELVHLKLNLCFSLHLLTHSQVVQKKPWCRWRFVSGQNLPYYLQPFSCPRPDPFLLLVALIKNQLHIKALLVGMAAGMQTSESSEGRHVTQWSGAGTSTMAHEGRATEHVEISFGRYTHSLGISKGTGFQSPRS